MTVTVGSIFGRLAVMGPAPNDGYFRKVFCLCECGSVKSVRCSDLTRKSRPTLSCGCLKREIGLTLKPPVNFIHGNSPRSGKSYLYRCWEHIKQRCLNPDDLWFHAYGGRGISITDEWRDDPSAFIAYVETHLGDRPSGYSIDRKDNDGNYARGNLRWASPTEQSLNTRRNRRISAFGKVLTISEWANQTNMPSMTIHCRLKRGWTPEQALTIPATLRKPNVKRRSA